MASDGEQGDPSTLMVAGRRSYPRYQTLMSQRIPRRRSSADSALEIDDNSLMVQAVIVVVLLLIVAVSIGRW